MVRRVANSRIPESVSRVVTIPGNDPVPTTVVLNNFNTIEITQSDNPTRVYEEGIDYILTTITTQSNACQMEESNKVQCLN